MYVMMKANIAQFCGPVESLLSLRPPYPPTYTLPTEFYKHHTDVKQAHIPNGKMHRNCRFISFHIVCKITQRNNIRRANTCDPGLYIYIYLLSVYSPFSDRVGLPLHNIHNPSPFTSIMDIFFVDLTFGHIHFYTL